MARLIGRLDRSFGQAVCYSSTDQGMGGHDGQKVYDGSGEQAR